MLVHIHPAVALTGSAVLAGEHSGRSASKSLDHKSHVGQRDFSETAV
jgi:hypothetical protein